MPLALGPDLRVILVDATGAATGGAAVPSVVQGGVSNNAGAPVALSQLGVLPAIANVAAPTFVEGRQVLLSSDLSGRVRVTTETQTVNVAGTTAGGAAFVGPSVPIGFVGTGATMRNMTAAPSVNNTTGVDIPGIGPLLKGTTNYFNMAGDDSGRVAIAQSTFGPAKVEDAGHVSGDVGEMPLAVRQDAQSALAGTTLDYIPFTTDANGSLRGVSGGYTTVLSAVLTRPADTTAYAAGDEMTDTGGTIRTITGAARFSAGSGIIQGVFCSQDHLWTTRPALELWIYDTTSTPVADNGAFAPTDAVTDTCIGIIPLSVSYTGTVNQGLDSGTISIPFLTVGSANLYFRVVVRNAAQDSANSGVSTFRFRILQD